MPGAAGHPGDQVGVDRADGVAAVLDQRPGVRLVLLQPHQLGAGEVRVQPQAGQLRHPRLVPLLAQPRADGRRTTVLPDDRAARGPQRLAVPEQHGLALVGDADGGHLAVVRLERVPGRLQRRLPDLLGGVLDPARSGEVLGELLVALGGDRALGGDDDRGDPGRPGVDREHAHADLPREGPVATGENVMGDTLGRPSCGTIERAPPAGRDGSLGSMATVTRGARSRT